MNFTPQQQQAIAARGNVLVVAGAGTGKTRTLVERCLNLLLEERPAVSLEEILMVTFTEAAAAEMRQRIRLRLEEELGKNPSASRWQEQLALFETAHIGTLHSFCLQLVRQHFYELELDPQLAVLAEEEARLLLEEKLDEVLQAHYAGRDDLAAAVQLLIQTEGRGWDQPVRALVLRLHHYTQTLPDPAGWFRDQLGQFAAAEPVQWREWLPEAASEWRERSLAFLQPLAPANSLAAQFAAALTAVPENGFRTGFAGALQQFPQIVAACPYGKKGEWLDPLKSFLEEAEFLSSLTGGPGGGDPLAEDWSWTRPHLTALLRLAEDFQRAFAEAKRELGVLDFHDLEQHALRLLWDGATGQPSAIARQWRQKLRFVFVDEYQDINAAQDRIIEALSRGGPGGSNSGPETPGPPPPAAAGAGNRFLVGDVKQSIYRFRLAKPRIFQHYAASWRGERGRTIPLTDNFRSREALLDFINSLFGALMQPEAGGLGYDADARLRFGAPEERRPLSRAAAAESRVELHLRFKGGGDGNGDPDEEQAGTRASVAELEEAEKEARLVASRLAGLKAEGHPVWDDGARAFRAAEWKDMAVLLRSPAHRAEAFAKEFSRLGVPLVVARGGFYESLEISDLLNLLRLLDNPLQDVPALAVLRSPLVGLTVDELAEIRLAEAKTPFWTALQRWVEKRGQGSGAEGQVTGEEGEHSTFNIQHSTPKEGADPLTAESDHASRITHHATPDLQPASASPGTTFLKATAFLARFARWRRLARQVSLSRCLDAVLAETHYAEWLLTQPRGEQRRANVRRLLGLAQRFDQFQRQGLFRFLRFVEAQQAAETEPEVAAAGEENAVRLMSIHQSKGLEFPVVVVAGLGKMFNFGDTKADVILDEQFGLCAQIRPPHTGSAYPSLPLWLARRRQKVELIAEELRLLYVATTRARDTLILTATIPEKKFETAWRAAGEPGAADVLAARSYADWLGSWFANHAGDGGEKAGATELLRWMIHDDSEPAGDAAEQNPDGIQPADFSASPETWEQLERRLAWQYPFAGAVDRPAKTSVTALRRQADARLDEETQPLEDWLPDLPPRSPDVPRKPRAEGTSAADYGVAHHKFLQFVALDRAGSADQLQAEARRLEQERILSPEETAVLDFPALAAFWESDLGRKIRGQASQVHRELRFTARFAAAELAKITGETADPALADDFVVVQGVADLAVILPAEIWLLDFKTDAVADGGWEARARHYGPQLNLYALALSRIYRRPVTDCCLHFLAARITVPVLREQVLRGF